MKVCDGVYSYVWKGYFENNCNMFYFGEPLNILFDPGLKHHLDLRFDAMKKDGLNPDDIKYVINTHSHPDHFEGSVYFMDKGIPVGMHKSEIDFLNKVGPQFFSMFGMSFPSYKFDLIIEEGVWQFGDIGLMVYHTPGHSPGSISLYWKEKKTMICGDLIFKESVGRVDFPGGDPKKLIESIKKISNLDIEILLPGHMDIIDNSSDVKKNFDLIERYFFSMM